MNETIEIASNGDFNVKYQNNAMEKCVFCGVSTDTPVHLDVSLRLTYVEGAGQLCAPCFSKIYKD